MKRTTLFSGNSVGCITTCQQVSCTGIQTGIFVLAKTVSLQITYNTGMIIEQKISYNSHLYISVSEPEINVCFNTTTTTTTNLFSLTIASNSLFNLCDKRNS